jgi:cellulose synthase/poly-beta-1,6-N-acetylglucosamine synthase-like glycosyltransferase
VTAQGSDVPSTTSARDHNVGAPPPETGSLPTVSVIVPSYGRPVELSRCLAALACQTTAPEEILVVIREGDEETAAVAGAASARNARTVVVSSPGQVEAQNAGLRQATGDVVAFTDDDAEPSPSWVERIAITFAAQPTLGALGGRDLVPGPPETVDRWVERVGQVSWFGRRVGNHHLRSKSQRVQFLKGVNMAFRRAALPDFDPRLRGQGTGSANDMDVSLAAWACGWEVTYDPQLVVVHHAAPRSGSDRVRKPFAELVDEAHNETYVLLKHLPPAQKMAAFLYGVAVGGRTNPGIVLLPPVLASAPDRADAAYRFGAALCGRILALRTYVLWRIGGGCSD